MTTKEELRECDVCRGTGVNRVEGYRGPDGLTLYRPVPGEQSPCFKCKGEGQRMVTVSDEREDRSYEDDLDDRYERALFEESQRQYR